MLFSTMLATMLLGWALVSADWWSGQVAALIGARQPVAVLPDWAARALLTLAIFLAYELAYWLFHMLSHRWPVLWAFHKVHHSAESLSPLTNFRTHPVDSVLFYNFAAWFMGVTGGLVAHGLGPNDPLTLGGANLLVFVTTILFTQLQHTHLWISLPGRWGNWLMSPAHHQLHHSTAVEHHDRNFGSALAVFDRLFGTLLRPTAKRQPLRFGVDGLDHDPHGLRGSVVAPFEEAASSLAPRRSALINRPA